MSVEVVIDFQEKVEHYRTKVKFGRKRYWLFGPRRFYYKYHDVVNGLDSFNLNKIRAALVSTAPEALKMIKNHSIQIELRSKNGSVCGG